MSIEEYSVKLKQLLGIDPSDTTKDVRIAFVLETVVQEAKNYCNIEVIPAALDNVILLMAEDFYRGKYSTEFELTDQTVQSVKRGDVETKFGSSKASVTAGPGAAFIHGYEAQLTTFRKMRW